MTDNIRNFLMVLIAGIVTCFMFVSCNESERIAKKYYIDKLKIQYQINDPNEIGN